MNSATRKILFKKGGLFILTFLPILLFGQNEGVLSGEYFSSFYVNTTEPQTGVVDMNSDGNGSGTFVGGTFTYTIDQDYNFVFNESFDAENHKYIGFTNPSGEYAIMIPDPATEAFLGVSGLVKLSDSKTNADFSGDYITSYYRYDASDDFFVGLFEVTADDEDTCTYHQLLGTALTEDEKFKFSVAADGKITLLNNTSTPVISASISESNDCYNYASILNGFPAIGYGVKKDLSYTGADIEGDYNLMQIRYDAIYGEESVSLISMHLNADETGTYRIDTNTHGEKTSGTLAISYVANGYWAIVLDGDSDHTIYGAMNPSEKLITGYFNYNGNSPGIVFGIEKYLSTSTYTISGTVSGADNVAVTITGDITSSQTVVADGGSYSITVEEGQSVSVTPTKDDFTFMPPTIHLTNITEDKLDQNFTANQLVGLHEVFSTVEIYPNPVTSMLSIQVEGLLTVELIDLKGEVQQRENRNSNEVVQMDVERLDAGIYLLRVTTSKDIIVQKVIIK
jgi:hypothetical protein